jgi:hypothetical protein
MNPINGPNPNSLPPPPPPHSNFMSNAPAHRLPAPWSDSSSSSLDSGSSINWQIIVIMLLSLLLVASVTGIDVVHFIQNIINPIINIVSVLFRTILRMIGYTTGAALSVTGHIGEAAGQGVEIVGQKLEETGKEITAVSEQSEQNHQQHSPVQQQQQTYPPDITYPQSQRKSGIDGKLNPGMTFNNQNPMASSSGQGGKKGGGNWCLAGTFQGKRGCALVENDGQCMSGQLFPNQSACMAPEY